MSDGEGITSAGDPSDDFMTALEVGRSESITSTSRNLDAQHDTASSPAKAPEHRKNLQPGDGETVINTAGQRPHSPPPSLPAIATSAPHTFTQTSTDPTMPGDHTEEGRALGVSLFSVPPTNAPHSGVYDIPLEAFEFRDLDSGRTFYLDKRYWIKDVDTGKVYVLEPEGASTEGGPPVGVGHSTGSNGSRTRGALSSPAPSGRTTPGGTSIRVSDLISGQELSLEEFEQALGYFREAPPPQAPSPDSQDEHDFATQAQLLAQRSIQSISLAAHASATWIKEKAMSATGRRGSSSQSRGGFSGPAGGVGGASFSEEPPSPTSTAAAAARREDGQGLPVKVNVSKKAFKELTDLRLVQTVVAHQGVIWTMRFSKSGRYLATAGQDCVVTVWEVVMHRERERSGAAGAVDLAVSPRAGEALPSSSVPSSPASSVAGAPSMLGSSENGAVYGVPVLRSRPVRLYRGHKQDILDVAWSKTNFLLSASMDKTVRLWHVSMDECLRVFKHTDFVTAIDFHPSDDKLFVSGSIDGKVRLWNVPEQRVVSWQDVHDMVTAVGYSKDGRRAVVGTMRGKCRFYGVSGKGTLEYEAQLDVKNKRGQHARGKKVTGLHFGPSTVSGEPAPLLITSNDSRIRLYEGYTLRTKYKGHSNKSTQIKASFSPKGDYVICGSDDGLVYMWTTKKTAVPGSPERATSGAATSGGRGGAGAAGKEGSAGGDRDGKDAPAAPPKEKNATHESFQVASDVITVALFGPECTQRSLDSLSPTAAALAEQPEGARGLAGAAGGGVYGSSTTSSMAVGARGQIILAAGYSGEIKIYENLGLPQWL